MPRRYRMSQELARLNASLQTRGSDNESDSDDDSNKDDNAEESTEQEAIFRRALEVVQHSSCPAVNCGMLGQELHELDEDEDQIFPNCSVEMPIPVFLPPDGHSPHVEPCVQRPHYYDYWIRLANLYKIQYETATKRMRQREKKHQENIYDIRLFDLAEHIAGQENAFFRDSYDYYYTGGNVNTMPFQDASLAIHVSGKKLNELNFSTINSEPNMWQTLHSEKLQETSSELFQILPVENFGENHGNLFMGRFLNEISLYELKRQEPPEEEEEEQLESPAYQLICQSKFSSHEAPLTSASQSLGKPNVLALACQDRSIRFLDILTQQDVAKHDVCWDKGHQYSTSTWAQLMPSGSSTFHFLTQPVLLTVDERVDQPLNPCYASSFRSKTCETFSCLGKGVNPNLLYVASNHKLHCLDLRCLGKNLNDRAVVTWTHQMTFPPCFMDTCSHGGSEYVALGGHLPGDLRICELKGPLASSMDEMFSPALPYAPPTLQEALVDARLRGCVDIYADLTERVKACVTGLRFSRLENANDQAFAQLLTANSLGDLYSQRLTPRDEGERIEEIRTGMHTAEAIRYYGSQVKKHVQSQKLRCTEVQSMPQLRELFREAAKRPPPDIKPTIIEHIEIDWGIPDSETSDDESQNSQVPEITKHKGKGGQKKKADKKDKKEPEKKKPQSKVKPVKFNFKKDKGINRGSWQKSAYQMARYKDMLTVRMLEVWDMEDFDPARDVTREMIEEKLPKELQPENRMASWLDQLSSEPAELRLEVGAAADEEEDERRNPDLVPGTKLPKLYGATTAEYSEVSIIPLSGDYVHPTNSFQPEQSVSYQMPSILQPGENTIIESGLDINPPMNPPPAKRPKYTMGF